MQSHVCNHVPDAFDLNILALAVSVLKIGLSVCVAVTCDAVKLSCIYALPFLERNMSYLFLASLQPQAL